MLYQSYGKILISTRKGLVDVARYRPAIKIVLRILESIARNQENERLLKTHLISKRKSEDYNCG